MTDETQQPENPVDTQDAADTEQPTADQEQTTAPTADQPAPPAVVQEAATSGDSSLTKNAPATGDAAPVDHGPLQVGNMIFFVGLTDSGARECMRSTRVKSIADDGSVELDVVSGLPKLSFGPGSVFPRSRLEAWQDWRKQLERTGGLDVDTKIARADKMIARFSGDDVDTD